MKMRPTVPNVACALGRTLSEEEARRARSNLEKILSISHERDAKTAPADPVDEPEASHPNRRKEKAQWRPCPGRPNWACRTP